MEYLDIKQHLVNLDNIHLVSIKNNILISFLIDIVPNDGQYPPPKDHHQKYLLATGPMCRYACDLQPMLKVLAGHEHIDKLLNIHNTVRFYNRN